MVRFMACWAFRCVCTNRGRRVLLGAVPADWANFACVFLVLERPAFPTLRGAWDVFLDAEYFMGDYNLTRECLGVEG